MLKYRAMTANCGNETLGLKASKRIAGLFNQKDKKPLDFCVINCQEVHFDKTKKELEQALKHAGLTGYSVTLVGKMTTPTKVASPKDIKNALWGNTGMASFIIHKNDIKIQIDSVEEARRNPWASMGTAYNKGGLVSRCTVTKTSKPTEALDLELVSGHLDSNKIAERAQDWGVIQKKLTPSSKKITDFKALSQAIPHLRLSGYDANTRNKIINEKPVNLWGVDTADVPDAFELEGFKQWVLGDARYSANSTYKTEDKTSATAPSPAKKRLGYTKGGMLDFVDILDGTIKQDLNLKGVKTIGSGDSSTKRDHAIVMSPEHTYIEASSPFHHTRDQMAAMLLQVAPKLAEDLRALKQSPQNEERLLHIYHVFLSREGLLNRAFDLFQEKLQVIQRVNKQAPEDKHKIQDDLFSRNSMGPWFSSVCLANYQSEVKKIYQQQEATKDKIKAIARNYPSGFSAMKTKLWDTKSKELESVVKPDETVIEAETWDLERVSQFYMKEYSQKPWYQPPEETDEGNIRVPFPDSKTALEFGEAMAKKGVSLMIIDDATGHVLAYSYGDGILNTNKEQRTSDDIRSDILAHKDPNPSRP
ncbi:MAG: hypothetical protein P1U39_07625 [Legionellaceae bacterium]|nr:hypothetical protein [Legionellaceae bacterium]